jgi:hypothetical protein
MSAKENTARKAAASADAPGITSAEAPSETTNHLFHEAMLDYEKALESGIQLQEDSFKRCKQLLARIGTPEAVQAKLDSLSAELFPLARKGLKEYVETVSIGVMFANRTGEQALDLFGKTLGIYQSGSIAEAQGRVQNLIEETLAAVRGNVRTVVNTNLRIAGLCKDLALLNPVKSLCAAA